MLYSLEFAKLPNIVGLLRWWRLVQNGLLLCRYLNEIQRKCLSFNKQYLFLTKDYTNYLKEINLLRYSNAKKSCNNTKERCSNTNERPNKEKQRCDDMNDIEHHKGHPPPIAFQFNIYIRGRSPLTAWRITRAELSLWVVRIYYMHV